MGKKNKNKNKGAPGKGWISKRGFGNQADASEFRRITIYSTLTTNAGSFVNLNVNSSVIRTSPEWASYSARWTEYRIIRIKSHIDLNSNATQCVTFIDRTGAASITTMVQAWSSNGSKVINTGATMNKLPSVTGVADDLEEQLFTATGSNAATFSNQISAVSSGASQGIGGVYSEALVEFRGAQ